MLPSPHVLAVSVISRMSYPLLTVDVDISLMLFDNTIGNCKTY